VSVILRHATVGTGFALRNLRPTTAFVTRTEVAGRRNVEMLEAFVARSNQLFNEAERTSLKGNCSNRLTERESSPSP